MKIQDATYPKEIDFSRSSALAKVKQEKGADGGEGAGIAEVIPLSAPPPVEAKPSGSGASGKAEEMKRLAEEIQKFLRQNASSLDFIIDKDLDVLVTKVLQSESGKVVRQFPPEEVLEVMRHLRQQRGGLVDRKG